MFASARLDVGVCLRCQLRQALRHIAAPATPLARIRCGTQHRLQSSASAAADSYDTPQGGDRKPRQKGYKILHPHGKIWGKKGKLVKEAREQLKATTLGRPAEVIVLRDLLRDLPEETPQKDVPSEVLATPEEEKAETSRIIDSVIQQQQAAPAPDDVNAAIDDIRKGLKGKDVVTEAEFDRLAKLLLDSYNVGQLSAYLKGLPKEVVAGTPVPPTDPLPDKLRGVQKIEKREWRKGTTPIEQRLSKENNVRTPLLANTRSRKGNIVDKILRSGWHIKIESEVEAIGELELLFTPAQMALLQTRNHDNIKQALQSNRFYRRSRYQLHQAENVLRIIGPRAEAESIAGLIEQAFADAKHIEFSMHTVQENGESVSADEVFTEAILTDVARETRAVIELSADGSDAKVDLYGFVGGFLRSARRILISLLALPHKVESTTFRPDIADMVKPVLPFAGNGRLPYRYRSLQLGRWTVPAPKRSKRAAPPSGEGDVESLHPQNSRMLESVARLLEDSKSGVASDMDIDPVSGPNDSIWEPYVTLEPLEAQLGQLLHPMTENGVTNSGLSQDQAVFTQQTIPQMTNVLSRFKRAQAGSGAAADLTEEHDAPPSATEPGVTHSSSQTEDGRPQDYAIAHFIPSPLVQPGQSTSSTTYAPVIEMRFEIRTKPLDPRATGIAAGRHNPTSAGQGSRYKREIAFSGITAVMQDRIVNVPLPHMPLDLRFRRRSVFKGHERARHDPALKGYIHAMEHKYNAYGSSGAPTSFTIQLEEAWLNRQPDQALQSEGAVKGPVPVEYLFQGYDFHTEHSMVPFEDVRELEAFRASGFELTVGDVQGDLLSGKRMEVNIKAPQVREKPQQRSSGESDLMNNPLDTFEHGAAPSPESERLRLLESAFSFIEMVDSAQRGTLDPRKTIDDPTVHSELSSVGRVDETGGQAPDPEELAKMEKRRAKRRELRAHHDKLLQQRRSGLGATEGLAEEKAAETQAE